jgi:hypothetical protein
VAAKIQNMTCDWLLKICLRLSGCEQNRARFSTECDYYLSGSDKVENEESLLTKHLSDAKAFRSVAAAPPTQAAKLIIIGASDPVLSAAGINI